MLDANYEIIPDHVLSEIRRRASKLRGLGRTVDLDSVTYALCVDYPMHKCDDLAILMEQECRRAGVAVAALVRR